MNIGVFEAFIVVSVLFLCSLIVFIAINLVIKLLIGVTPVMQFYRHMKELQGDGS